MAFFTVEALAPLASLVMAGLFAGTLIYLVRLNQRLGALRGAQSELHGLLRACSDNVDAAEKSIAALRAAAQGMAGDLGRSLERAQALKAEIDTTCAAAARLLARLSEEPALAELARAERQEAAAEVASAVDRPRRRLPARLAEADGGPAPADPAAPAPVEPRWTDRLRPAEGEREAMRLFRDTIRAL